MPTKIFAGFVLLFLALSARAQADSYEEIRCRSENHVYNECRASSEITHAQVVQRHSDARCDEGRDWGFFSNRLWVDDGCEATFGVWVADNFVQKTMRCRSVGGRYHECESELHDLVNARLQNQISDAECRQERTWGIRGTRIWVGNGCEGDFLVEGYR